MFKNFYLFSKINDFFANHSDEQNKLVYDLILRIVECDMYDKK